jgi:hypothetical protein
LFIFLYQVGQQKISLCQIKERFFFLLAAVDRLLEAISKLSHESTVTLIKAIVT